MSKKLIPDQKKPFDLEAEITHPFPEHHSPFDLFLAVTTLDPLVKIKVQQSNLYSQQMVEGMKAFLGINYVTNVNKWVVGRIL